MQLQHLADAIHPAAWDVEAIRDHFVFPQTGRTVTNNAASTQPPRELLGLYRSLAPQYENVHRGQSSASQETTRRFEAAYDDIARFVGARSRNEIVIVRGTTEAHNAVMYSLLTEFRDGDNVVTTKMEHNSNFVPWLAMSRDILPKFGRRVEVRLVRFDPLTGELDLGHMASLIDERTKLVCCTAASNFLGVKNPLAAVRALTEASGYRQPGGERRSYLLVDGAQWVPSQCVDMQALGADYLSFSFHKMLAPFGVGVLVAKEHLLEASLPFLYGGDMVAEGQVFADRVGYNALPWKYAAGTPNIIGTIVSAQALRLLLDLALTPKRLRYFDSDLRIEGSAIACAMGRVADWNRRLTERALDRLGAIPGLTIYGPRDAARRSSLVAFNVKGHDPVALARSLNEAGVEARAGCHCATLAHQALGIDASCRLSFYLYNTVDEVDRAVGALADIVTPHCQEAEPAIGAGGQRQGPATQTISIRSPRKLVMNVTLQKIRFAAALLSLALGACGGGGDAESPAEGVAIGAAGGTVVGPMGVTVVVPAGALTTNVAIAVAQTSAGALALPGTLTASGPMFALTPHGTTFALPVTITVPFTSASIPAGLTPQLYKTNVQGEWEQVANAVFGATTVTAQITSFSFAQVVVPPLQRNDPVREWEFQVFPGNGGAAVTLPVANGRGTQTGGAVEETVSFGPAFEDEPIIGFSQTLLTDGLANGFVFSTANGVTYGVFAEAPFATVGGPDPTGSRTRLKQTQSFIKRAADATLTFTLTRVTIQARDFQPPPARSDRFIKGEVLLSVGAYKTSSSYFFYTAGKASVIGAHKTWFPSARNESFSRTHLWDMDDFDFTTTDDTYSVGGAGATGSCPGTRAQLLLKVPLTYNVDLSSVRVGEEFTLRTDTYAEADNRRGGPASFIGDCLASSVDAFLRDPLEIGGTTLTTSGLEPTNRPLPAPPEQVLVPPAACVPGPGPTAAAGVLQFSAAAYSVSEFAGAPSTVTVTRTGGSSGAVTATFTTSDGTGTPTVTSGPAIAGVDYTAVNTTVFFGDGDAGARLVTVPTIQNLVRAPDKTLNLTLSQPGACAALGPQSTAVLTIVDDGGSGLPAPPSGLDTGFGVGGKASTAFGGDDTAMALQADGKIVMVGGSTDAFALARFNADGSLDAGFGSAGLVTTDLIVGGIVEEVARAVAIQADGRIVVAGFTGQFGRPGRPTGDRFDFALARYNADGSLDTSFGTGGKVTSGVVGRAFAVAVQPDGRIVVAGDTPLIGDVALARYHADGSLDASFGNNGQLTTDFGNAPNLAANIVLQADGAIVVSGKPFGSGATLDHTDMARYLANGSLDASFGVGGKVTLSGALVGEGLARQGDGKFVLVGSFFAGTVSHFALRRLNADGSTDATFGTAGSVSTDFSGRGDSANAVAVQADGKIVVAGKSSIALNANAAVARYTSSGALDTGFGNGFGILTVDFFGSTDSAESVALQADGRIVVGGLARNTVDGYGLARFNP